MDMFIRGHNEYSIILFLNPIKCCGYSYETSLTAAILTLSSESKLHFLNTCCKYSYEPSHDGSTDVGYSCQNFSKLVLIHSLVL